MILLHVVVQFSHNIYRRGCIFPLYILTSFVVDELTMYTWVYFHAFFFNASTNRFAFTVIAMEISWRGWFKNTIERLVNIA